MIFVTHQLPVNVPGEPHLDRAVVWYGLVLKANNALPFVPSMTFCEATHRCGDTVFDRDIDFRGDRFTERRSVSSCTAYPVGRSRLGHSPVIGARLARASSASSSAVAAESTVQSVILPLPPSHVPAAPAARCR